MIKAKNIHLYSSSKPVYGSVIKRKDLMPPSKTDIKYTKELFTGFDINMDIPEFSTKNDLYNWRDRVIRNIFD